MKMMVIFIQLFPLFSGLILNKNFLEIKFTVISAARLRDFERVEDDYLR
jgi:hypothetical protein